MLEGELKDQFDTVLSTPSECADQLAGRSVDVGLIPSIEYQRIKGTKIVPGPVISSHYRVKSVLLVSEVPLWRVRTVAHDKGSRTSVALAQIVFKEFYKTKPEFRPAEPDLAAMLATSDAALIIGDNALKFMADNEIPEIDKQKPMVRLGNEPLYVFDLMERWHLLTGLPFVFAFWAARDGFGDNKVTEALNKSRDLGVASISTIAERYAEQLSIKKEYLQAYLERNIEYHFDRKCVEGLELFYDKAAAIGAIKSARKIEFV